MKIDPKDLIPITDPFHVGGIFYMKVGDGIYEECCFHEEEKENGVRWDELMYITKVYKSEGRLFLRRTMPWGRIAK
jgi:hypothetical protein